MHVAKGHHLLTCVSGERQTDRDQLLPGYPFRGFAAHAQTVVFTRIPLCLTQTHRGVPRHHRYARLTLDLANKLVSCFRMEGGAANVVIFLVEAAVRAGARDGGIDMTAAGGGGIHDRRRRRKHAGYFDETVEFVSDVAKKGLERAREAQRQSGGNSEAEETEEACLTLLQGLSGFAH